MDKIEFEMRPSKAQFQDAITKRLFVSRFFWVFWLSMNFSVLILLVWFTFRWQNAIFPMGLLLALTLTGPFSLSRGLGAKAVRTIQENGKLVLYFNQGGLGIKSDTRDSYVKWSGFASVRETERYIFMVIKKGHCVYIFKELLKTETLKELKDVLNKAAIPRKNLT